ncbi:MAG: DUF3618 domain-containing protein [Corynebacterium sp.]|nr:DUF3618 domain-containing protein [Corynebacterium sp.]
MARDINDIERDIERTRKQLASTLDQIADRAKPQNVVNDAKKTISEKLKDPQVRNIVGAVAGVTAGIVIIALASKRRRNRQLRELRDLLAA